MEDKNERPVSPVTLVYSQLQRLLTPDQCDRLFVSLKKNKFIYIFFLLFSQR
jgi:hypothetical protein